MPEPRDPASITRLLSEHREGNPEAMGTLMPLLYDELRNLARTQMRQERTGHTLQPTALVNEAYVRLVQLELGFEDRAHFLSMAARVMRRVLVDHARARRSAKRGGDAIRVSLDDEPGMRSADCDIMDVDDAIHRLRQIDERQSQLVELHYFGGLSYPEIAEALQISPATVGRDLRFARAWLRRELEEKKPDGC